MPKQQAGRPRDSAIDSAVLSAALELAQRDGYSSVSVEAVARHAETSRPAVYRRWPGRTSLLLAAIADRLSVPAPPDTGCTLCDIGESFEVFLTAYRTIEPDLLIGLYADCARDPALAAQYVDTIVEPARRAVGVTLDRAIARGDLRVDVDRNELLDLLASLVHYRAQFRGAHMSADEAERAIEMLLRGAARDYDELLAHSLPSPDGDHPTHAGPRPQGTA